MVEVRNTLWFENTLKCGLYPIHSAKNTFNSYIIKQVLKLIYICLAIHSCQLEHHTML